MSPLQGERAHTRQALERRPCGGVLVEISGPRIDNLLSEHTEYERAIIQGGTYLGNSSDVQTIGVRTVVVTTALMSDIVAYEITKAVFDNFEVFRRLHPAFEKLSITDMFRNVEGGPPLHPGSARYYRERGLP